MPPTPSGLIPACVSRSKTRHPAPENAFTSRASTSRKVHGRSRRVATASGGRATAGDGQRGRPLMTGGAARRKRPGADSGPGSSHIDCPLRRECARRPIASNLQSTIRDLQRRKARGRRGLALIEGVRLVEEALAAGLKFRGALVAPELSRTARGAALVVELERHAVPVEEASSRTLVQLADTDTPQGIVAVVEPRKWTADDLD